MDESKKGKGDINIPGSGEKSLDQVLPYFEKRKRGLPPEEPKLQKPIEKLSRIRLVTDFDPKIPFKNRISTDRHSLYHFNPERNLPANNLGSGKRSIEVLFDTVTVPTTTHEWLDRLSHFEPPKDFVHPFTLLDIHKKQGKKKDPLFTFWYDKDKRLWCAILDYDDKSSYFGINETNLGAKFSPDFFAALQKGNGQKIEIPNK